MQVGTSRRFDSDETDQAGVGDVITSRSRVKLKSLYGHYYLANDLPWGASTYNVTEPFEHVFLQDHVRN